MFPVFQVLWWKFTCRYILRNLSGLIYLFQDFHYFLYALIHSYILLKIFVISSIRAHILLRILSSPGSLPCFTFLISFSTSFFSIGRPPNSHLFSVYHLFYHQKMGHIHWKLEWTTEIINKGTHYIVICSFSITVHNLRLQE